MSLELSMLPLDCDRDDWGFSHSILWCSAESLWHDRLKGVPRTSVPKNFSTYLSREDGKESHYGDTPTTPYGEPLECVTVGQIIDALNRKGFWDMSSKDLAVNAYLQQLTKETRIALYWH